MKKIKVMSVFGTRPEAIKMLPLVKEIASRNTMDGIVCVTAQHREMLDQVMEAFDVEADFDLDLMKSRQTLYDITSRALYGMEKIFEESEPDIVLVHGDTTTSFAGALAAFYKQIKVGHVEAGLRSFNKYSPFPEEMNRLLTDNISDIMFAPTKLNAENLRKENHIKNVYITGNTIIDALYSMVTDNYSFENEQLRQMTFTDETRTVLLTCHRRENLGEPMRNIFHAVLKMTEEYPDVQVIYPVHRNPAVMEPAEEILGNHPRIHLIDPIGVRDMHNLFSKCYMVMTDSGGLQEEAPALGKPVLVLRTETERPEAVEAGTAKVVGVKESEVLNEAKLLLDDRAAYGTMANAKNPYGDGKASIYICDAIEDFFKVK